MKFVIIMLFTCLMQVSASSLAQRITLSENNVSIELLLKKIKQQTGYDVLYGDKVLNNEIKISVKLYKATISEALDMILESQKVSYTVVGIPGKMSTDSAFKLTPYSAPY